MGIIKPGGVMRYIDPNIFCDEWYGNLDPQAKQLWIGLIINLSDDQGRLINNPSLIRIRIYPYDRKITDRNIKDLISKFVKANKLISYTSGLNGSSKNYLQIRNFWNYQKLAQWAGPSDYPAPEGWKDRLRYHAKGEVNNIKTENWGPVKAQELPSQVGTPLPSQVGTTLPSQVGYRDVNVNVNVNDDVNDNVNTNQPVLKGSNKKMVGLVGKPGDNKLSRSQRVRADKIKKILILTGVLNNKAEIISVDMAIRSINPGDLLAALASCYEDPKVKNIPMAAIYRINHNTIPNQYRSRAKWGSIPKNILEDMGIKDLNKSVVLEQLDKFKNK
jgi:hypothetical protein